MAPFTNRTSRDSPAGSVLLQSRALTSLRRITRHGRAARDRRVELVALQGDLVELDDAAEATRTVAGGETKSAATKRGVA